MKLIHGDCRKVLQILAADSVDAIVTDPPYGLEFMGKDWDKMPKAALTEYMTPIFAECLRVLKPGGHLLAFGGSRTYHRLASAVEDAGFEIRDQIMWLYGTGFPKSQNVAKAMAKKGIDSSGWQGWGTALKPAHEPIVMARKPLIGTVVKNVTQYGAGAINIDGCRVRRQEDDRFDYGIDGDEQQTTGLSGIYGKFEKVTPYTPHQQGRWPANVIHDGGDEVLEFLGDPARFFYSPKANKKDRGEGNKHPTVKPTDLMCYLIRMVTPPGGTILDPFMGSGSTGKAAKLEGFDFIGVERNDEYFPIAVGRVL